MSASRSFFQTTNANLVLLAAVLGLLVIAVNPIAQAQSETVAYTFCSQANCVDGAVPYGNLLLDASGNLYGTTYYGGPHNCGYPYIGCGTIFELAPSGVVTVRHSFNSGYDSYPEGSLIEDAKGNLYGATTGADFPTTGSFLGSVFELKPRSFRYLYRFSNLNNGATPNSGLVMDGEGNLYGTTQYGGANSCGTGWGCGSVFKLTPKGEESVLYSFAGPPDGERPYGGLVIDSEGNLYGTTAGGGSGSINCATGDFCGTVFKISPSGAETILYSFLGGNDGGNPLAGLVMDKLGNLYGTTEIGGSSNNGTVFKITPDGNETVLYRFKGGMDGSLPLASLVLDSNGNLYGTTARGGGSGCSESAGCGIVFEISSGGSETILYRFTGSADGGFPESGLVFDGLGNLYGTTVAGGVSKCASFYSNTGCGVVFKVRP